MAGFPAADRCGVPLALDVKCAGCNAYFPLPRVVQEDTGYYCKKCLKKRHDARRHELQYSQKCIFCGRVLTESNRRTVGGFPYCSECGEKVGGRKEGPAYKCSVCGELLSIHDARMVRDGKEFCDRCYRRAFDEAGVEKTYKCWVCGKSMGPFEVKMRSGQNYCEKCHSEAEDIWEAAIRELFRRNGHGKPAGEAPEEAAKEKKEEQRPETDYAETAQLFKCLGDPCRVKIIESLAKHDMSVFAFVEITGFQYSAISYHLKMLKDLGLVDSARNGNFQVYSLTEKGAAVHEFIRKSVTLK